MMTTAKKLIQRWVLRAEVAGAAITTYLLSDPTAAATVWQALPFLIKNHLSPTQTALAGVVVQLIGFAATVKRNKQNEAVAADKGGGNASQ